MITSVSGVIWLKTESRQGIINAELLYVGIIIEILAILKIPDY
jgi:hypothetical protein